jgi:hypothetical protein
MYFKVKEKSKLFEQLKAIETRIKEANDAATTLVKEMGYEDFYRKSFPYVGGGISAIVSKTRPADWASMAAKFGKPNLYMPKRHSKGKVLWDKIEALPLVKNDEIYKIINYPTGLMVTPGIRFGKATFLIQIDESINYVPVKGMVEILASEFKKLSEIVNKEYEDAQNDKKESEEAN